MQFPEDMEYTPFNKFISHYLISDDFPEFAQHDH